MLSQNQKSDNKKMTMIPINVILPHDIYLLPLKHQIYLIANKKFPLKQAQLILFISPCWPNASNAQYLQKKHIPALTKKKDN